MPRRFALRSACGLALGLAAAGALAAGVVHSPAVPNVDRPVTFQLFAAVGSFPSDIRWSFGDGTTADTGSTPYVQKTYSRTGAFTVVCRYKLGGMGNPDSIAYDAVTVVENRRVAFAPASPLIGQAVAFQAVGFFAASIRWDFGDGAIVQAGTATTHAYAAPGAYTVKAFDFGGQAVTPVTAVVSVGADTSGRRLALVTEGPYAGRPATFQAIGFFTTQIRWDFGDGTPPEAGSTTAAHAFARAGSYLVQAWDWNGAFGGPTSLSVSVLAAREESGPRAAFAVSYLRLRFEDGKAYAVVPKGREALRAFADLKFEGTGLVRMQWLVDGAPFGPLVTRALGFASAVTLDSGAVPGLPTLMPGMHEVSVRFLDADAAFELPFVRYFVTADEAVRPADLPGLRIELDSIRGISGARCALVADGVEIAAGGTAVLRGVLAYDRPGPARFALLRVHVGDRLVDQRLLTDLAAGDRRPFETSIANPGPEPKTLYLTVYELDAGRAELIHFRKLALTSPAR